MGSPTNAIIGLFMLWLVVDIVANIQFTQSKLRIRKTKAFSEAKISYHSMLQVGLVSFQLWQHFWSEWKEVSASIFYISIIIITIIPITTIGGIFV